MSNWISYQPLEVEAIQEVVFPYVFGSGSVDSLLDQCESPLEAENELRPYKEAYRAMLEEHDYCDDQFGRCDPLEFIYGGFVSSVLRFAGHLHPSWGWNVITSVDLVCELIPVHEVYEAPILLFSPLSTLLPELHVMLASVADAEGIMGGIIRVEKVPLMLATVKDVLSGRAQTPEAGDDFFLALKELKGALEYACEKSLSYVDAYQ